LKLLKVIAYKVGNFNFSSTAIGMFKTMKPKIIIILFLFFSIAVEGSDFVWAESIFIDPNIPNGETITYKSQVEDKLKTIVEKVVIKKDGDKELYEITSFSESMDMTILLEKKTMSVLSIHTVRKYEEVTLDLKLKVIGEKPQFEKDNIKIPNFSILQYVFRGFPFMKLKKLKIGFYGEERKGGFKVNAECKKIEKLKVNQKTIECYKVEFSMDSFWKIFFPKTTMWYSVDSPHYLVRYEGAGGPPGSPKKVMELVNYNVMGEKEIEK
jgi:hypothetical protein